VMRRSPVAYVVPGREPAELPAAQKATTTGVSNTQRFLLNN
jgi:hypothetical protein